MHLLNRQVAGIVRVETMNGSEVTGNKPTEHQGSLLQTWAVDGSNPDAATRHEVRFVIKERPEPRGLHGA